MASNYKANIDRMVQDDAFDPYRDTGKKCQYTNHRSDNDAIIMVEVDNDCCPNKKDKDKNHVVRLCWRCCQYGYRDDFICACGSDEAQHSADALTFKGELASVS